MEFKVGDKVRLVSMNYEQEYYKKYLGKTYTIARIGIDVNGKFADLKETDSISPFLKNLELVKNYTYENLKKAPIGTKVTFENGAVLVKDEKNCFENVSSCRNIADLCNLKDNYSDLGKIIKIEEPEYTTVYEYKPEILDKVEKRYLKEVIRPYKDVISIRKCSFVNCSLAKIVISVPYTEGHNLWSIELPPFKKNTMYKNMELNKKYTLTELGLKE